MSQKLKWYDEEKLALVELIRKYKTVIECKETDSKANAEKGEIWNLILDAYNSGRTRQRSLESMKNCWAHQKTITRKNYAALKQETYRTGGGVNEARLDLIDIKTMEIIKSLSVEGMNNIYDSDAQENSCPNDPIFEHLLKTKQINDWKKCQSSKLKSQLSPPLVQAITGTSKIHALQGQKEVPDTSHVAPKMQKVCSSSKKDSKQSWDSYKSTKADVFNLVKENLMEKKGLEKKLLKRQIQRENLQLKILKRKLQNCDETLSSSDSD